MARKHAIAAAKGNKLEAGQRMIARSRSQATAGLIEKGATRELCVVIAEMRTKDDSKLREGQTEGRTKRRDASGEGVIRGQGVEGRRGIETG